MKKPSAGKTILWIAGTITLLLLLYLTASLASPEFKPAVPFYYERGPTESLQRGASVAFPMLCAVVITILMGIVILLSLSPEQRKKILWGLLRLLVLAIVVMLFIARFPTGEPAGEPTLVPTPVLATFPPEPTTTPVPEAQVARFDDPAVSPLLSYLVTLAVLLGLALGAWWFLRSRPAPYLPLSLGEIAESTLQDLESGRDWGNSILDCYVRMMKAVEDWRGIRRRIGMNPTEFATQLVQVGLPPEAVQDLTALFEKVRYGSKRTTRRDIQRAVECLTAIVEACRVL